MILKKTLSNEEGGDTDSQICHRDKALVSAVGLVKCVANPLSLQEEYTNILQDLPEYAEIQKGVRALMGAAET